MALGQEPSDAAALETYKSRRLDLKGLFIESYTMLHAEMKRKVESREDDVPIGLPVMKADARRRITQARVGKAINMDLPHYDCSHASQDLANHIVETNRLAYVGWDTQATVAQEGLNLKKDPCWKPGADGIMRYSPPEVTTHNAELGTDLLLERALTRRGLTFDQANLMDFSAHDLIKEKLTASLLEKPPDGFMPVSLDQLYRADMEIFRQLASQTRNGVRAQPGGSRPLDALVESVLNSPRVNQILSFLQGRAQPDPNRNKNQQNLQGGK